MGSVLEVVTRWDDTLLDVAYVGSAGTFALAGTELVRDGRLVGDTCGRVGQVAYAIREVTAPVRTLSYTRDTEHRVLPYLAGALALHLGLWAVAVRHAPPDDPPRATAQVVRSARPGRVTHAFAQRAYVPAKDLAADVTTDTSSRGQGAAMRGEAGAAGARAARAERGHVAVQNIGEEAQLSRTEILEQARHAGILGSSAVIIEQYQALTGSDHVTSGFDGASVNAPLDGGAYAARGDFGLARAGTGGGGGGAAYGTIGTGRYAYSTGTSIGHGWGGQHERPDPPPTWTSGPYSGEYAYIPHRIRIRRPLVTICGAPYQDHCRVTGALDNAIVRRYVRRRLAALAYCYEKALLATPSLASGAVFVDFTIRGDGTVAGSGATGVSDEVATCVGDVVENIAFPRGATHVEYVVSYNKSTHTAPPTSDTR